MVETERYRWDLLIPAHRYVFALEGEDVLEFNLPDDEPADLFRRYQELKAVHPVHGMIAWPNTLLLRGPVTAVVDPGLITQGPPLLLALARLGVAPEAVDLVVNTHRHVDHTHANAYFPQAKGVIHALEYQDNVDEYGLGHIPADLWLLEGNEGEIAPGLRFVLTPGHTEGSICVVFQADEGLVVVAGDTVGPLPEYFESMDLPDGFPGRAELLDGWRRIRALSPALVIPGHNPPVAL